MVRTAAQRAWDKGREGYLIRRDEAGGYGSEDFWDFGPGDEACIIGETLLGMPIEDDYEALIVILMMDASASGAQLPPRGEPGDFES